MKRSEERILTTHVGSMVRPTELLELAGHDGKPPENPEEYARRARQAVSEVVRRQIAVGLDIVNDGEFGKESWANYILKRLSGFESRPDQLRPCDWIGSDRERFGEFLEISFPIAAKGRPTDACIGPIAYRERAGLEAAIANLKSAVDEYEPLEAFMTAVAPASTAYDGLDEYYGEERAFVFAIAEALREEYLAIHAAGFVVQVDDAVLANMYDTMTRQSPERYREWAELRVEALNHALRGIPKERIRYHVCFGSWHMPHMSDAPLEEIVDIILQAKVGAYSLEAANPRHEHEWRVWQDVKLPDGCILIPGVVTHHTVTVEHPRVVADRIVRYANIVGRENVIAGTDCGFAQTELIQRVHPDIMWAKYEVLVEGARIASEELWGTKIEPERLAAG